MCKIAFVPEQEASESHAGLRPMCKGNTSRPFLTVEATGHLPSDLYLVECASCETMYFLGDDCVLGYDFPGFEQDYWYSYVQNGAGISAMLEPLLAIGGPRGRDLLDIGCGFGFVPDFWQRSGIGQGVGLETSRYGKVGREKLGVEIIAAFYNDAEEIAGRKFDYVYSSEVLEHVDLPPRSSLVHNESPWVCALRPNLGPPDTGVFRLCLPIQDQSKASRSGASGHTGWH